MTPHLSACELNKISKLVEEGKSYADIRATIKQGRDRRRLCTPTEDNIRKAGKAKTHKRGVVETRGRKTIFTPKRLRAVKDARKVLQKKFKGKKEVTYGMMLRRARVKADPTNLGRHFKKLGVQWRSVREKPTRTKEQKAIRKGWCKKKAVLEEEVLH